MKMISEITQLCAGCMNIHTMQVVEIEETELYKGKLVSFVAEYNYCEVSDTLIENEEQIRGNFEKMKKGQPVN